MDTFDTPEDNKPTVPLWARSAPALRRTVAALRTESGITATASLLPATLVTGCANLATHQLYSWQAAVAAVAIIGGTGYLGVKGLAHKWTPAATWTFLGTSAVALDIGATVVGQGWTDFFSWGAFVAASFGARLAYLHGTAEKRSKVRTEDAKSRSLDAKTELTLLKAQTEQIQAQLKLAQLDKLNAPEPEPYRPNLAGFTVEEAALRVAFWDIYQAELLTCDIEPTLTGYAATIGLPHNLSRDQVKTQWDKISTALRVSGRFVLGDGTHTNELRAKFIDATRKSDIDVTWSMGRLSKDTRRVSLGIDTETGEEVFIRFDERTLVCGASGTGKSWSTRSMMAHAHIHGDLVLIDGKGEEGNIWELVARVANEAEDILDLIDEMHAEMNHRKVIMKQNRESVWSGTQLTAMVDEGQVVLSAIATDKKNAAERLQKLRELSSLGRSRGIVLWWATQKPVMSGSAPGVDNLIAPNLLQRFSLRVADSQEARTALDDCAYYAPHAIPDNPAWRGHGYLKGYGPSLIRTWTMDDEAVMSLPEKKWGTSVLAASGISDADKVTRFFLAHPEASGREAARELDIPESTVRRIRKTL